MRYRQFRVSLYSSHNGKGYLTGETIPVYGYHCHHVIPKSKGGTDALSTL